MHSCIDHTEKPTDLSYLMPASEIILIFCSRVTWPETLQITYIPKVLASYIQYFLIFLEFFCKSCQFVLKVACPQSRIVLKVACPQSRVLKVVSSKSSVLIVP